MEILVFRYSEYEKLYNCSYDINSIPIEQRINHGDGFMLIGLSSFFVAIYIPSLIVMWKHMSKTAYQIMFIMGFVDAIILTFGVVPSGIMSLMGVVFCSYPTPIYISGCLLEGLWVFSTEMSVVLTLYRCLELVKLVTTVGNNPSGLSRFTADWFFKGKRYLIWISLSVGHSISAVTFDTPTLYSPIFGTMLLNPHAGYIEDVEEQFHNLHSNLYTMVLLFVGVVLFVAFVYLMRSLRKINSNGPSRHAAEQKALAQAVIINSCFAISVIYWCVVYNGSTVPRIAAFIGMTISICCNGMPGLLYVCMNETVRDSVLKLLQIRRKRTTVVSILAKN